MPSHLNDPDFTSPAHIHRALQRAVNDSYCPRPTKQFSDENGDKYLKKLARCSVNASKVDLIASRRYINLEQSIALITANEIKSSVERSRRWSGVGVRDGTKKSTLNEHTITRNLIPDRSALPSRTKSSNCDVEEGVAAETAYHNTICDILSAKSRKSSYGHLSKALERTSVHLQQQSGKPHIVSLPKIVDAMEEYKEGNIYSQPARYCSTDLDWTLRYSQTPFEEKFSKLPYNAKPMRSVSQPYRQHHTPGPLNIGTVLNETTLFPRKKKCPSSFTSNSPAQRALRDYFKRERSLVKAPSKYVVTVRLPNPAASLDESTATNQQKIIKLSMRTGSQAGISSLLPKLEKNETNRLLTNTSETARSPNIGVFFRKTIEPFLFKSIPAKTVKT